MLKCKIHTNLDHIVKWPADFRRLQDAQFYKEQLIILTTLLCLRRVLSVAALFSAFAAQLEFRRRVRSKHNTSVVVRCYWNFFSEAWWLFLAFKTLSLPIVLCHGVTIIDCSSSLFYKVQPYFRRLFCFLYNFIVNAAFKFQS